MVDTIKLIYIIGASYFRSKLVNVLLIVVFLVGLERMIPPKLSKLKKGKNIVKTINTTTTPPKIGIERKKVEEARKANHMILSPLLFNATFRSSFVAQAL